MRSCRINREANLGMASARTAYTVLSAVVPYQSFAYFIHESLFSIPNLKKVKVPTLIIHASVDPVTRPQSAFYIHQNLSSSHKVIYLFESNRYQLMFPQYP